ncbi:MAG: hypothetical protein QM324_08495 [Bacteroidota bacterium]|jgi:hypothetical protein|nr:hypothetical protein [Bacteroidota bacterium]
MTILTNQELLLKIADDMELLSKSIRRFGKNIVPGEPDTVSGSEDTVVRVPAPVGDNTSAASPVDDLDPESNPILTLEVVREVLARKSVSGKSAEVQALIHKYGADRLSRIDPAHYTAIVAEAEML